MYNFDIEQFWKDDDEAHKDNCFNKDANQIALGIRMSDECVFAELGEEGEPWGFTPRDRRIELNKRYNEKALQIVGRKLLNENIPSNDEIFPAIKQIGEVFGGRYEMHNGSMWLTQSCETEEELEKILDTAENIDLRSFILPKNWHEEKKRIFETYGKKPGKMFGVRGPVTLATSIFGVENLIYLYYDNPDLYERFRDVILKVLMDYITITSEEAGFSKENPGKGFAFFDDNCCLLTEEMYRDFGLPILKAVFDRVSPNKNDFRYQHSDSDMGHLLDALSSVNLTNCNFGPTITVKEIRNHMPNTCIEGQLAPFTFMSNDEDKIIQEIKRDCEMAKENNLRGLKIMTAGSINNGSLLTSMKAVMYAITKYGRY